jgi:hypothetical protein
MADNKTTEYVTLVSNDGFEFKLLRSAACIAGTIKKALDPMCMNHLLNNTVLFQRSVTDDLNSWLPRKHPKPRQPAHDKVRSHTHFAIWLPLA